MIDDVPKTADAYGLAAYMVAICTLRHHVTAGTMTSAQAMGILAESIKAARRFETLLKDGDTVVAEASALLLETLDSGYLL